MSDRRCAAPACDRPVMEPTIVDYRSPEKAELLSHLSTDERESLLAQPERSLSHVFCAEHDRLDFEYGLRVEAAYSEIWPTDYVHGKRRRRLNARESVVLRCGCKARLAGVYVTRLGPLLFPDSVSRLVQRSAKGDDDRFPRDPWVIPGAWWEKDRPLGVAGARLLPAPPWQSSEPLRCRRCGKPSLFSDDTIIDAIKAGTKVLLPAE